MVFSYRIFDIKTSALEFTGNFVTGSWLRSFLHHHLCNERSAPRDQQVYYVYRRQFAGRVHRSEHRVYDRSHLQHCCEFNNKLYNLLITTYNLSY